MNNTKDLFLSLGLNDKTVADILKNASICKILREVISEAGVDGGCNKEMGNLLYQVATKFPNNEKVPIENRAFLVAFIGSCKIKTDKQLKAALDFIGFKVQPRYKLGAEDIKAFEEATGVGIEVSREDIEKTLDSHFSGVEETLKKERYGYNVRGILNAARKDLPWANDKLLKELFDAKLVDLLGHKTEGDKNLKPRGERKKSPADGKRTTLLESVTFHKPEDNLQPREELLKAHLSSTGGKVITRFPPEPNGYLHLGHCKAMNLNFNYAKRCGGLCYMRFDDTNPHTEKQEYIDSALDNIKWLGHNPYKITYASDYFEELYEFAVKLIRGGKAYVCHQTADEIAKSRDERTNSPYRNRPIEESLSLFEDMRKGKIAEGKATLRLKMDMSSNNPNMRDLVAYRIKFANHPHVGDKWCIYPSYDYTHCICDSLENITHSLCTLEFQSRNESYRWLLDALDIYRCPQIEYSRVNLTYTVLSKRKLIKLVDDGYVKGWDDPRMPTINGMRRRGYPAEALNKFCEVIGITKNHNVINLETLEHEVRCTLDGVARRGFGVLNPLEVTICNYDDPEGGKVEYFEADDFPNNPLSTKHKIPFTRTIYIDASDFRESVAADCSSKKYYGLTPGGRIRLRHAYVIECTSFEKDVNGKVTKVLANVIPHVEKNPKGVLHWVAKTSDGSSPIRAEIRLYDVLFRDKTPGTRTTNFLDDFNSNSLVIKHNCFLDVSFRGAKPFDKFQLERVGFFSVDPDSTDENPVLNLTVSLKESKTNMASTTDF